jgi:hypothetical protein
MKALSQSLSQRLTERLLSFLLSTRKFQSPLTWKENKSANKKDRLKKCSFKVILSYCWA